MPLSSGSRNAPAVPRGGLIAVGAVYVDINCPEFPLGTEGLRPETETVGGDYALAPGGSAVNFALLCSSLGLATELIGKVGADAMGELLLDLLRDSGVRPHLIVDKGVTTNVSMNLVDQAGRSVMAVVGDANRSLGPTEVVDTTTGRLPTSAFLYLGGCFKLSRLLPAFDELVGLAKASGTQVIMDHGRLNASVTEDERVMVRRLAQRVDYYLPSRLDLLHLWRADSIDRCMRALDADIAGTLVVKDGERGAVTVIDDEVVRVPAYDVNPIHTVGAGDTFNAGLIAAMSHGQVLLDAIRFACASAALSISRPELPTWDLVCDFMRTPTD